MKNYLTLLITCVCTVLYTSITTAQNCDMTLKTTIEGFKVYKHNVYGVIMFKAKMAIDADGSPRAYGPNNSGLDYTANAGHPGNWWGIATDNNGNPIIQSGSDPYPGMYVSTTSLENSNYGASNPLHYVNSEAIPFFVLPSAVTSLANIHLGDIGYVYNTSTGQGCYAVFADGGPSGKLGEGSIYLANQIGVNSNARTGGTDLGIIDYIVFPGSGSGQGSIPSVSQINSIGANKMSAIGGTSIVNCLTPGSSSCGTPTGLTASAITNTCATLSWTAVAGATSYTIQYKPVSSSNWVTVTSANTSKVLNTLTAATAYQFQVQALCSSNGTYSASSNFTTTSTGSGTNSVITVGTGTSSYSAHPFGTVYMDERVQYIVTQNELATAGWSSLKPFLKSMAFNVATAASQAMLNFTITISKVSATNFSNTTFLSGNNSTLVFSGTLTAAQGWNTVNFNNSFNYDGNGNLLVSICWNNSGFTSNSSVLAYSYSNYVALYYRADVANGGVCGQSTGTLSYYRPNMQLGFSSSPNLMSNDGGSNQLRDLSISPTALNDFDNNKSYTISVFPNPSNGTTIYGKLINETTGNLNIETDVKELTVKLFDLMGREIFSQNVSVDEGQFSLPLSSNHLQTGTYFFVAVDADAKKFTQTIIVR